MKTLLFVLISVGAGAAICFQSALSGELSKRLSNPMIASASVFLVGFLALSAYLLVSNERLPSWDLVKGTPKHLWVVGGIISACALSAVYWVMPQIGVSAIMLYLLTGQLIASAVIGHFAWFGLPVSPLSMQRCLALGLVLLGAFLFNLKPASSLG